MTRTVLPSLLTVFCLTLAGVPTMAATIFNNGTPTSSSTTLSVAGAAVLSNTFTCSGTSCTPSSLTFYGTAPTFSPGATLSWSVTSGEDFGVNYGSGLSILPITAPCNGLGQCLYSDVPFTTLALPHGTFWLNVTAGPPGLDWWSSGSATNTASWVSASGISLDPAPGSAFAIKGTVTPEPRSILMLGSGILILGLVGVLRRKRFRCEV